MIGNDKVVEAEVVSSGMPDVVPNFAITLEQAKERLGQFKQFIKSQMVKNIDYGRIPGVSKPSLFKPGAEKLCNIFGFAPQFEMIDQVKNWEKGFFHYQIKCRLVAKGSGMVVAEGVGSCNSKERRYRNQDAWTLDNTILKMAKKRAHIDATLTATRASGEFTQDIEDIDIKPNPVIPQFKQTPSPKKAEPTTKPEPPRRNQNSKVSNGIMKSIHRIARKLDVSECKEILKKFKLKSVEDVKTDEEASYLYNAFQAKSTAKQFGNDK